MSANCRYVITELFFLACLQRICPALLFQGSQPRPLSTHLFSQLPQAKCPNRLSYWTPICPALHLKTKVIPKLHHMVTEFKPSHRGIYLVSLSCVFPRPGPSLLWHSQCMPKSPSLFLVDVGPIDSDICHSVNPGPVPTLFQTFQSEFIAICNPPDPFPQLPQKRNK